GDPADVGPDEQVAACTLGLRSAAYLPLRIFEAREIDASQSSAEADALLGVLASLSGLPPHWRALVQLVVVGPAKPKWARPYQRMALEPPLDRERLQWSVPSFHAPLLLLGLLALYAVGSAVLSSWTQGRPLDAIGLVLCS